MYFDKSTLIESETHFIKNQSEHAFNVAYGIDKNFMFGAAISATSIIVNNQTVSLAFHFFTDYIDDEIISRFEATANKYNVSVHIYKINTQLLSELPQNKWPCSTYFRLVAFDYLDDKVDKLLYIDADVMCKNDLTALSQLDFQDAICAVVPDIDATQEQCAKRLSIESLKHNYFNAGVMYMHLKNWKDNELTKKTIEFIRKNTTLKYPDQDALNILLLEKTILLPRKFNCIYSIKSELKDKTHQKFKDIINNESVFIHYVGTTKPWCEWGQYPSTAFFQHAYQASTWNDVPLVEARTPTQWKKKSKHEFRKYHFLSGILARLKYITTK